MTWLSYMELLNLRIVNRTKTIAIQAHDLYPPAIKYNRVFSSYEKVSVRGKQEEIPFNKNLSL